MTSGGARLRLRDAQHHGLKVQLRVFQDGAVMAVAVAIMMPAIGVTMILQKYE
jgi:ABC-type glycerol-3-phosphate transport system permease component